MDEPASTVVVVGASAGGVEALTTLARGLPDDLDAAVCVVLHLAAGPESHLAEILARAGPLPAIRPRGGERLAHGRVYVAPPDRHLVVRGPRLLVGQGARENGVRPSIDVLFRSAALAFGRRTVAVVLSGARDDGVAGASAVGACGGCVLVQSPDDAPFPSMPAATVARDHPDRVLPLAELAAAVADAVGRLSEETPMRDNGTDEMSLEPEYATISPGVLGAAPAGESVEAALWTALRTLQERAQLSERLAARVGSAGARRSQARFEASAREAREQADAIRRVLAGSGSHG